MLRRRWNSAALSTLKRHFTTTCVLRIASNSDRMSPETARKVKEEDRADVERERKLREQFAKKIQDAFGQQQQPSQGTTGGSGNNTWGQTPPFAMPTPGSSQFNFMRLLFFGTSIYLLFTISNLQNPESAMMMMQGQPWWQVPGDVLVLHALIRNFASFREQRQIKSDYEVACKQTPTLSLSQFLSRSLPNKFGGYRTSQAEVVAALMATHAVTRDLTCVEVVSKAARSHPRDYKAAIDHIMDILRTDVPQIFSPVAVPAITPSWQAPVVAYTSPPAAMSGYGTMPPPPTSGFYTTPVPSYNQVQNYATAPPVDSPPSPHATASSPSENHATVPASPTIVYNMTESISNGTTK